MPPPCSAKMLLSPLLHLQAECLAPLWTAPVADLRSGVVTFHPLLSTSSTLRPILHQAWADVPTQSPGEAAVGGDVQLVPDMSTLRRVPWYKGHAIVLTDMLRNPQFSEALDGKHVLQCSCAVCSSSRDFKDMNTCISSLPLSSMGHLHAVRGNKRELGRGVRIV